MEKNKVSTDFSINNYSDKELNVKTNFIIDQMTDNVHFVSPLPTMAEMKACNDRLSVALVKMEDGNKQATIDKNSVRAELENMLKKLAAYVQQISDGDELIISGSGMDMNKKRTLVGVLPMVTGIIIKAGAARGSLDLIWDVVPGTLVYEIRYTEFPSNENSTWMHQTVSKHRCVLEGLTRGKQYVFQVVAIGSDPSRIWSDEITSYVM